MTNCRKTMLWFHALTHFLLHKHIHMYIHIYLHRENKHNSRLTLLHCSREELHANYLALVIVYRKGENSRSVHNNNNNILYNA